MSSPAVFNHEIRTHATLASIGVVILLPIGMLIPRYLRTTKIKWFWIHALWQSVVLGPVLITGIGYGIRATQRQVAMGTGVTHLSDPHKKAGLAILILYVVQVLLGLFSHYTNYPTLPGIYRTPQRILHIMIGLSLFGLGFWQVNYGYSTEWPMFVGSLVPASVNKAWKALVIIFPILYGLGWVFLPKQISQESAMRRKRGLDESGNNDKELQ